MKINNLSTNKLFFTSDTHFGHSNIIKYCNRPFVDTHDMNTQLSDKWNEVVPEDGIIFHLGDFTFRAKNAIKEYRKNLNGIIYLSEGNHDNSKEIRKSGCFETIADLYDLDLWDFKTDEYQRVTCCHYPMVSWNHSMRGAFHTFGHVHAAKVTDNPLAVDVGVDEWNYYPISYYQLKEYITQKLKVIT